MKYIVSLFTIGFFLPICAQTTEIPSPPKCKKTEGFDWFENLTEEQSEETWSFLEELFYDFSEKSALNLLRNSSLGKNYTGTLKHCNGKKVDHLLQFKNGSFEGVQKIWNDYGYDEWHFQNGRLEGVQKQWLDGEYSEYNYKNGQKEGIQIYMMDGIISSSETYKNGSRHGISKSWDDEANLESEQNYKDGELDGWQRFYASDGSILGEANLIDGNGTLTVNYENGQVHYLKTYVNGSLSGLRMIWYRNGQMKDSTVRSDQDYGKSWYSNGQLESHSTKSFDRFWDENGNIEYEYLLSEGISRSYFENGQLESEESLGGMENKIFYKNGQLKRHYIEEDDNGYYVEKEYYENGQLKHSLKEHYDLDTIEEQCWDMDGNEINCD